MGHAGNEDVAVPLTMTQRLAPITKRSSAEMFVELISSARGSTDILTARQRLQDPLTDSSVRGDVSPSNKVACACFYMHF